MTSLSRIAEALEKLIEEEAPQHDPYRNEQRIADALERIATAGERIASVLELRMPWNFTVPAQPIPYPYPAYPFTNPTVICANSQESRVADFSGYTPPPVSYPDYSEPTTFSCGVQSEKDIPF